MNVRACPLVGYGRLLRTQRGICGSGRKTVCPFDGIRFTRWTDIGEEAVVFALSSARDGSLWVGLAEGGVVRIIEERLERYGRSAGIGEDRYSFCSRTVRGCFGLVTGPVSIALRAAVGNVLIWIWPTSRKCG